MKSPGQLTNSTPDLGIRRPGFMSGLCCVAQGPSSALAEPRFVLLGNRVSDPHLTMRWGPG